MFIDLKATVESFRRLIYYFIISCILSMHKGKKETLALSAGLGQKGKLQDPASFLKGKHFHFSSSSSPPGVTIQHFKNGSISSHYGFAFEIIDTLKSIYNFTYTVTEPSDGKYGANLGNGSWSGIIGMVSRKECDMGIGTLTLNLERYRVVDYATFFLEEPTTILIPPPTKEARLFACVRPFQFQVWIGLLSTVAILPIAFWFLQKIMRQQSNLIQIKDDFSKNCIFVFGVLMTQSGLGSRFALNHSTTILAIIWCLIVVVFNYAYIGTLVSFLSVPKLKPLVDSIEDLPTSGLTLLVPKGTAFETIFTEATEGIYKTLGDVLRSNPEQLTSDELAPQRVITGNFAFIYHKPFNELVIEQEYKKTGQCCISLAKKGFFRSYYSFVLPKGSKLKPIMDKKLFQMLESGIIAYWKKRLWPSVKQCDPANFKYSPRSLHLDDMQSPFLVLAVGMVVAIAVFVMEHIRHYLSTMK